MKILYYRIFTVLLLVGLVLGCRNDRRRTLFEMIYPNILFEIPAGLGGGLPRVFELEDLRTNFREYLQTNNTDTSFVAGIEPVSANLIALDGERFDFLREVSIRICKNTAEPCNMTDEVFYLDRIQETRIGNELRLLPTLIDAERILAGDRFKLEVWFYLFGTTPATIPIRMDLRFDALRDD